MRNELTAEKFNELCAEAGFVRTDIDGREIVKPEDGWWRGDIEIPDFINKIGEPEGSVYPEIAEWDYNDRARIWILKFNATPVEVNPETIGTCRKALARAKKAYKTTIAKWQNYSINNALKNLD